jgi:hypothetical protein
MREKKIKYFHYLCLNNWIGRKEKKRNGGQICIFPLFLVWKEKGKEKIYNFTFYNLICLFDIFFNFFVQFEKK